MRIRLQQMFVLTAALCGCAFAQESANVTVRNDVRYFHTEIGPGDKVVKGAPYTADAVTETVQTLANGNHIVHKNTAQLARDSEGRTRREQTMDAVGPWATGNEPLKLITLNDPVAGVAYHLDPKNNTATKFPSGHGAVAPPMPPLPGAGPTFFFESSADGEAGGAGVAKVKAEARFAAGGIAAGPGAVMAVRMKDPGEAKSESLGQQTIEGILATGTRTTRTIAAGAIGNEQPIEVTSETWYSPDLQMVVMSKHNDPQIGETTYKLTNIQRSAPPQSLFEVPANYTIQEEEGPNFFFAAPSTIAPSK
jgi:hypothetical protein